MTIKVKRWLKQGFPNFLTRGAPFQHCGTSRAPPSISMGTSTVHDTKCSLLKLILLQFYTYWHVCVYSCDIWVIKNDNNIYGLKKLNKKMLADMGLLIWTFLTSYKSSLSYAVKTMWGDPAATLPTHSLGTTGLKHIQIKPPSLVWDMHIPHFKSNTDPIMDWILRT